MANYHLSAMVSAGAQGQSAGAYVHLDELIRVAQASREPAAAAFLSAIADRIDHSRITPGGLILPDGFRANGG